MQRAASASLLYAHARAGQNFFLLPFSTSLHLGSRPLVLPWCRTFFSHSPLHGAHAMAVCVQHTPSAVSWRRLPCLPVRAFTTSDAASAAEAEEFVARLMADLKEATMAKDKARLAVVRRLRSEIMNKEKVQVGTKLSLGDCMKVVQQMIKQCEENAKEFDGINQAETAAKEREEARLLRTYLPPQFSEAEVQQLAQKAIKETGATTIKDMKNVMAKLSPQVQGKADPSFVGETVKKLLGGAK